jgi:hypothetical protein
MDIWISFDRYLDAWHFMPVLQFAADGVAQPFRL